MPLRGICALPHDMLLKVEDFSTFEHKRVGNIVVARVHDKDGNLFRVPLNRKVTEGATAEMMAYNLMHNENCYLLASNNAIHLFGSSK